MAWVIGIGLILIGSFDLSKDSGPVNISLDVGLVLLGLLLTIGSIAHKRKERNNKPKPPRGR